VFDGPASLVDILADAGLIPPEKAGDLRAQIARADLGEDEIEALLRQHVSDRVLTLARKSRELAVPCVSLREHAPDPAAVKLMRASYAYRQRVAPIALEGDALVVAVADPTDVELVDEIRVVTDRSVRVVLADSDEIEDAIRRFYGRTADEIVRGDLAGPAGVVALETIAEIHDFGLQADAMLRDPTVKEAVDQIIIDAVRMAASDIHIEPFERDLQIRYRIDGVLERRPSPPKHLQPAVISRVKLSAQMNIAETRRPQDGRIPIRIKTLGSREIDLRVSTVPTLWGESVVMRILDKNTVARGLTDLGLMEDQQDDFRKMIQRPYGIVLATGPTGSGKTTTLYAFLKEIREEGVKIITIEDPVEYDLDGINQIHVRTDLGLTFADGLRHILRQDPDKVMVGEIRDYEAASMAIQAALTGHLVFSSLHTNDAPSAVTRLIDMGVEPYLVASTLEGIIAQRLPRRVCRSCADYERPTLAELRAMGVEPDLASDTWTVPRPVGCRECRGSGYHGRIGIFEVIVMNEALKEMAHQHATTSQIRRAARKYGMKTLREDGWRKVLAGLTTVEEVQRLTPEEDTTSPIPA
jgi:type II secretory ATPase GspE/PulE/Tfp pilus assembly ATPase PilB-like protein